MQKKQERANVLQIVLKKLSSETRNPIQKGKDFQMHLNRQQTWKNNLDTGSTFHAREKNILDKIDLFLKMSTTKNLLD